MPHDHHDHLSPSGHPYRPDNDHPLTYWQQMEIAVREILIEKGVTTAAEINAHIEAMDARSLPMARVVARAWTDADFREALLLTQVLQHVRWGLILGRCGSSHWKTRTRCTTSSSARCAPATRATFWVCRLIGTSRAPTGHGRSKNHAKSWPNLGWSCQIPQQSAFTTVPLICAML